MDSLAWSPDAGGRVLAALATDEGILQALQALQSTFGYIPEGGIDLVAEHLNVSRADVHGVLTFYDDLITQPPAPVQVLVCAAEACQAVGCRELIEDAVAALAPMGGRSADGRMSLREVFCLGNCALGPAVLINEELHGRVNSAQLQALAQHASVPSEPAASQTVSATLNSPETIIFVPQDSAACSVGANEVAAALAEHPGIRVVRNGSRGMLWMEPLVEVVTAAGRIGYQCVRAEQLPELIAAGLLSGTATQQRIGVVEEHPYLAQQQRVTFARVGVIDPLDFDDFVTHGGLTGLRQALTLTDLEIVGEVLASGLRGRGGAGFPTGIKWQAVLDAPPGPRYICCNADEGDSGTFADRMLIEGDPFTLIEGMVIAGIAVGARQGYIYLRSEYPAAARVLTRALTIARARGLLGTDVLGSGHNFDIALRMGAGSYVCGEETAMLESLEGKRGMVRAKPPIPAISGLFGAPTIVNNAITLATVPAVLAGGATAYQALGNDRSRGTSVFQLAGNIAQGGIVETAFGITLRTLVDDFGAGTSSGRPVRAVQVGGPLGAYLPASALNVSMDYENLQQAGGMLGHGGVVVFDDTVDMSLQARFAMEFCAKESCGKCTPCRVGAVRGTEVIDRIRRGHDQAENLDLLADLCDVMTHGSLCAMGGLTPMPVLSAVRAFPEDFGDRS